MMAQKEALTEKVSKLLGFATLRDKVSAQQSNRQGRRHRISPQEDRSVGGEHLHMMRGPTTI